MISVEVFAPGYQRDTVWAHLGPLYIEVLASINMREAKEHLDQYTKLIETHGNYLELFNPDGTPYRSWFYYADEGMLWASVYLDLVRRLR